MKLKLGKDILDNLRQKKMYISIQGKLKKYARSTKIMKKVLKTLVKICIALTFINFN